MLGEKQTARVEEVVSRWTKGLALDAGQQAKLREVVTARQTAIVELRKAEPDAEQRKAKAAAVRKDFHPQMRAVLTPEQKKAFKAVSAVWKAEKD